MISITREIKATDFTEGEKDLIRLISRGILNSKNLARQRQVSPNSIEQSLVIIRGKMRSKNRLELAFSLCESNLLEKLSEEEKQFYQKLEWSAKEIEIIKLLLKLNVNFDYEISSQKLKISPSTLKKHLKGIRSKLHCSNLGELVIKIYQASLIKSLNLEEV
ncbi:hypothetical protein [Crocosphaera sp. XPORK-15E]|uniref:hypothetical protein n=1 Tax=Crocosphaera sp. XPORK-15E TaxID=3110247 RepID=UPI002B20012D|nr:hypothetical protein [Crocosphaera sp. XPORK-15E]MEA5537369.1 hypothetical protein [Crocosphaera sp. XPORK-15E]